MASTGQIAAFAIGAGLLVFLFKRRKAHAATPGGLMDGSANAILRELDPGSRPSSEKKAAGYRALAERWQPKAAEMGARFGIPPAVILGLMSRETGFLTSPALRDGWGDGGKAFGILQVDKRSHSVVTDGGPGGDPHIEQALGIFSAVRAAMAKKHPDWSPAWTLAAAIVSYNAGHIPSGSSPADLAGMDAGTAGKDYGRDVIAQAKWFADNLRWSGSVSGAATGTERS